MTQTMQKGRSVPQMYAALGAYTGYVPRPVNSVVMLIMGDKGVGKSTLIEDNPHLLRFDLDRSGSSNPSPRCVSLPAKHDKEVSWKWLMSVVEQLIKDAKSNNKHFDTIAFDTIDRLVPILKSHVSELKGQPFEDLDTRQAYGLIYDKIAEVVNELINCGYGIIATTHICEDRKQVGYDKEIVEFDISMPPKVWRRIMAVFDVVVEAKIRTTVEVPMKPLLKKDGTPFLDSKTGEPKMTPGAPIETTKRIITTIGSSEALNKKTMSRVPIPAEIVIPRVGGWDVFEAEYNEAVERDRKENETND